MSNDVVDPSAGDVYRRMGDLGKGRFSRCFVVEDQHKTRYALKVVDLHQATGDRISGREVFEREVSSLQRVGTHPYIVQLHASFVVGGTGYIVEELCQTDNFNDRLQKAPQHRMSEPDCARYIYHLLKALTALHKRNIVHKDIKLSNLLCSGPRQRLKVADLGFSYVLVSETDRCMERFGTPMYAPPEMLDSGTWAGHRTEVDVWCAGVCLYMMLCGKNPFAHRLETRVYQKIRERVVNWPRRHAVADDAKDLTMRMMDWNPTSRISANEAMHHPFIRRHQPQRQHESV